MRLLLITGFLLVILLAGKTYRATGFRGKQGQ